MTELQYQKIFADDSTDCALATDMSRVLSGDNVATKLELSGNEAHETYNRAGRKSRIGRAGMFRRGPLSREKLRLHSPCQ